MSGTDGEASGMSSGGRLWTRFLRLFGLLSVFLMVVCAVNVSSLLIEHPAGERSFAIWEPVVWEGSSAVAILMLLPLVWSAYHRFHGKGQPVWRLLALHAGIAVLFSLLHVAIMVAIRVSAYAFAGAHYDFAQGDLVLQLVYEARKDAITYAILFAAFWTDDRLSHRSHPKPVAERLEVRTDGRTYYIDPGEIALVEAAGNYVELHQTGARPILVRGTMTEFEERLKGRGFVRIHRSRLLNRSHVSDFEGTPSGDLRIRLIDGREIAGSRRYRSNLEKAG